MGLLPPGEWGRAFLAVAEHGGFRAASRVLGQTASALSHAVAGLGRTSQSEALPPFDEERLADGAGRRLAERLMPALSEIGMAVEELHDQAASPSGLVRINCDANAAEQVLMPLFDALHEAAAAMRFEIRSEGRLVDIAEGGFDCGIRAAELVPARWSQSRSVQTSSKSWWHRPPISTMRRF